MRNGPTYHETARCRTCDEFIYDSRTSPPTDTMDRASNRSAHKQHYIIQSMHRIEYCEIEGCDGPT